MPTWQEVQEYVRENYKLSRDEEDNFALIWAYDDDRSQQIFCRRFTAFDQEFIEFRSPVCRAEEMSPKVAMIKNANFALGHLALNGDIIFFLHNVPLKHMAVEEFEMPLHVIAATADRLEQDYSGEDTY